MTTYQQLYRAAVRRRDRPGGARDGSVTLEFILVLPVLLIVLLAAIEFGMFFVNMQQVALACRVGAEAASQTDLTTTSNGDPVPADVVFAVNQQLESSDISPGVVILEHNVPPITPPGPDEELKTTLIVGATCNAPGTALPLPPGAGGKSVRLTICVPMTELAPNCLALFGFNLATRCAKCSTTFRYELSTP
jgi:hypothetical protein